MSRYIVEWHVAGSNDVRSDSVNLDDDPSDTRFQRVLASMYKLATSEVCVYMYLLQDEPRTPLNGRWGSFFKN